MNLPGVARRTGVLAAVLAASFWIAPVASAHVSVGVGISVPGVTVGVGNCWNCGYYGAPAPVYYYPPVYAGPAYYPAPVYYGPAPAYYGYGYYRPYYRGYRGYRGPAYYHGGRHGGYYGHGHR